MENVREVVWKQLTLGHLSRNKFWGEDPDTQYHTVVASTTLLQDGDTNILVDPTLPVEEIEKRLQMYCGLTRDDIDIIFATHFHTDHRVNAEKYPNAKLYMYEGSLKDISDARAENGWMAKAFLTGPANVAVDSFMAAPEYITPGVRVQPLPGHCMGLAGLEFTSGGKKILLSGDTIMNREFYNAREGYFIDASLEATAASMNWAHDNVDIIVPGHGDWFFANEEVSDSMKKLTWRKLNLCADGEETAVLVQAEGENIVINPTLSGFAMRDALYDARWVEPAAVTRVLCLSGDAAHTRDLPTMMNAKFYLPEGEALNRENSAQKLTFSAWEKTEALPIETVKLGWQFAAVFTSGVKKIVVACAAIDEKTLGELDVDVAIMGSKVQILR